MTGTGSELKTRTRAGSGIKTKTGTRSALTTRTVTNGEMKVGKGSCLQGLLVAYIKLLLPPVTKLKTPRDDFGRSPYP